MIARWTLGVVFTASVLCLTGGPSHAADSRFNKCIGVCTTQEYNCRFAGTYTPKCQGKFRICADSCARTGRPISFRIIR
jgi:hypothetical protein